MSKQAEKQASREAGEAADARPVAPKVALCRRCGDRPKEQRWRAGAWEVKGANCVACRRRQEKARLGTVEHGGELVYGVRLPVR